MNSIERNYIWNRPSQVFNPGQNFPGTNYGGSIQQVKELIQRQKRSKGFSLPIAVGGNSFQVTLSGNSRMLLGFSFLTCTPGDTVKLKINQEIICDNTPVSCLSLQGKSQQDEYFLFPRPLSGQDEIIIDYNGVGAITNQLIFYYL